jgi:3-oxoacyl-[acyl-carrier protein] reductase
MTVADRKLEGKAALVTGAAQGIGKAIARKLASEGASVLANDLDAGGLEEVKQEIAAAGGICEIFPGDVTAADFGDEAVAKIVAEFGDLHILVNNAGYIWNSRIINHSDEQWYAMIDVHATGPFRILRAAGQHFRKMSKLGGQQPCRKVVNISSVSGLNGAATQFSYSAAKSALFGMTRSLSQDWGRYNVTVNCVAFGYIDTRLTQTYQDEIPQIDIQGKKFNVGLAENQVGQLESMIPLRRTGTVDDAAGAVYLFCAPESDFVSGEILVAGGGLRS